MGILLEADYKRVVQGRESIVSGLQRAFSPSKLGTQDPLKRNAEEDLRPQEVDSQLTYEVMNRDTGMLFGLRLFSIVGSQIYASYRAGTGKFR